MKFDAKRREEERSEGILIFKKKCNVYIGEYTIQLDKHELKIIGNLLKLNNFNKLKNDDDFLRYSADNSFFLGSRLQYRGPISGYLIESTDIATTRQFGYWLWDLNSYNIIEIETHSASKRAEWETTFINNYKRLKQIAEMEYEVSNSPENESIEI